MNTLEANNVELQKFRAAVLTRMPAEFLDWRFAVGEQMSVLADELVIKVTACIYGEVLQDAELRWPADWWQAVKERFFSGWMRAIWPVRYRTATAEVRAVYPGLRPSLPEGEYPAKIVVVTRKGESDG